LGHSGPENASECKLGRVDIISVLNYKNPFSQRLVKLPRLSWWSNCSQGSYGADAGAVSEPLITGLGYRSKFSALH